MSEEDQPIKHASCRITTTKKTTPHSKHQSKRISLKRKVKREKQDTDNVKAITEKVVILIIKRNQQTNKHSGKYMSHRALGNMGGDLTDLG